MNPDGHITIQRSISKALLMGQEKFGGRKRTPLSTWDVFKREKKEKALGDGFPLWTELFGVASVSLDNEDEMARHELEIKKKSMCVLLNVKLDTGLYHVCVVKPL